MKFLLITLFFVVACLGPRDLTLKVSGKILSTLSNNIFNLSIFDCNSKKLLKIKKVNKIFDETCFIPPEYGIYIVIVHDDDFKYVYLSECVVVDDMYSAYNSSVLLGDIDLKKVNNFFLNGCYCN